MKRTIKDEKYVLTSWGVNTVTAQRSISGDWLEGTIRTWHGIVEAMTSPKDNYSRIDFVWRGHHYIRIFKGPTLTARGLAMAAKKFTAEIAGGRK